MNKLKEKIMKRGVSMQLMGAHALIVVLFLLIIAGIIISSYYVSNVMETNVAQNEKTLTAFRHMLASLGRAIADQDIMRDDLLHTMRDAEQKIHEAMEIKKGSSNIAVGRVCFRWFMILMSAVCILLIACFMSYIFFVLIGSEGMRQLPETNIQEETVQRERLEQELEQTMERLSDMTQRSAMTEVATSVLHNVGNILNSINVTVHFIEERICNSKITSVAKVAAIMAKHSDDLVTFMTHDDRGKKLPSFLSGLSKHLLAEQQDLMKIIKDLQMYVHHTADIINLQQSYSKQRGKIEPISIEELMEDAIKINLTGLKRHAVTIKREFGDLPHVFMDRHKLLQILVNLISNAKYALSASDGANKLINVRITEPQEGFFQIEIIDNGVGICSENLSRIFDNGFTTRQDGHGFGLHSAQISARQMGGSLDAHSDGEGKGAVFTLTLPYKPLAEEGILATAEETVENNVRNQ
ncbi:MAG: sensor histidine kinase [bacterium]